MQIFEFYSLNPNPPPKYMEIVVCLVVGIKSSALKSMSHITLLTMLLAAGFKETFVEAIKTR
jgi:hypothetical protein